MTTILLLLTLFPFSYPTPFGSKAPYELVAGNILDYDFSCKPVAVFSVHRHGTRNVGKKIVNRIDLLLGSLQTLYLQGGAPSPDLAWILDFGHRHQKNKDLILEGYTQLLEQGQRFHSKFPDLFTPGLVEVGTSTKGRCISSALSFLTGVYQDRFTVTNRTSILRTKDIQRDCAGMCHVYEGLTRDYPDHVIPFNHQDNHLTRYYEDCRQYVIKEAHKNVWQAGPNKYVHGTKMKELTERLGGRLGVTLSPHDTVTLHIICALEVAAPRLLTNSHFCDLFQEKELYTTAFYLDLMRYSGKMMAEAVNASCVLLQDGLDFLREDRGVRLKFAHTETIFPLLEHIGYLTQPMRPSSHLFNRQFFGDLTPLGSNLVFVASQCEDETDRTLQLFLNEKPVDFPACGRPCKLGKVLEMFPREGCDFVGICETHPIYQYVGSWELLAGGLVVVLIVDIFRRRIIL